MPPSDEALKFEHAFKSLAHLSAMAKEPWEIMELFEYARNLEAMTKTSVENARAKMLSLIQKHGTQIPDGKGMQIIINGKKVEARLSRDGLDVKKIQAWLLAKGKQPQEALAEKITFALAPDTEKFLREMGASDEVLLGLKVEEPTWSVYKPVEVDK